MHKMDLAFLLENQKVIKDYSHPTHYFSFSVPAELHEGTHLLRGVIEFS